MEDQGIVPNWQYISRDLAKPCVHETSTSFELTAGEEVVALESHLGASPCHVAVFILLAIVLSQHLCKVCSPYVHVHVVTLIKAHQQYAGDDE